MFFWNTHTLGKHENQIEGGGDREKEREGGKGRQKQFCIHGN